MTTKSNNMSTTFNPQFKRCQLNLLKCIWNTYIHIPQWMQSVTYYYKKKLIMHECFHIFNDNDNGQDVKKGTRTFFVVWG